MTMTQRMILAKFNAAKSVSSVDDASSRAELVRKHIDNESLNPKQA